MTRRERGPKPYREETLAEKWKGWARVIEGMPWRPSPEEMFYAGAAALLELIHSPTDRTRRLVALGRELDEFARSVAERRRTTG